MNVTWKNVLPIPVNWNTPEVIIKRQQYVQQIVNIKVSNKPIFYCDETGFNLHTKKSKGRAVAGEPAVLTLVPKGKRVTVIACIGPNGFVHTRMVITGVSTLAAADEPRTKGTTAEHFRAFLIDLAPKLPQFSYLFMDNAKIHHAEKLLPLYHMIEETYKVKIRFTGPYSPFISPIEYGFNKLKAMVNTDKYNNQQELINSINKHIPDIDADDATGFYNHCAKYYPQALLGLPFTGKPLDPNILSPEQEEQQIPPPNTNIPMPSITNA